MKSQRVQVACDNKKFSGTLWDHTSEYYVIL